MPPYPRIEVHLSIGTWSFVVEVFPDTGFEGGLTVPRHTAQEVGAEPFRRPIRTADGAVHLVDSWDGEVEIQGRVFPCEIMALGSEYLLGREVLDQLDIRFEFGTRLHLRFRDEPPAP